jgi:threonine-phosphate decarboxylase
LLLLEETQAMTTWSTLHGGDVVRIATELHCEPEEILDFSANINPRGLPCSARLALTVGTDRLCRYPDPACHPLRQAIAERHGIATENVVIGAGASALILDAFRAVRPRRCLCVVPAFAEYRRASAAVGSEFHTIPLSAGEEFQIALATLSVSLQSVRPDLLVLNNPHNPSGSLVHRETMVKIMQLAEGSGAKILVDEAFIDYAPVHQITALAADREGVIAVRSLTKFYGCPGLRVGYAVAEASLAGAIERQMPAWPVGTQAMDALRSALQDDDYEQMTLQDNARERVKLTDGLMNLGCRTYPAAANFVLTELPASCSGAASLKTALLKKHRILVRDCSSFEGLSTNRFIRIAVLDSVRNERLLEALRTLI